MSKSNRKIVTEKSPAREVSSKNRKRQSLRSLRMRRKSGSLQKERPKSSARDRVNSTAKSKKRWSNSVLLSSNVALKPSIEKKRLKLSKKSSKGRPRPYWNPNSKRLKGKRLRWTERTRREGGDWRRKTSSKKNRARLNV
jgi:hypothetical protein